ncbi:translation initiation factor eIF-1A [Candidatus Undinarchaeota archaeon]
MVYKKPAPAPDAYVRLKLPREGEQFGVVEEIMGGSRLKVRSEDGKTRICRIRGKMRKKFWIRLNDIVIIKSWDFQTVDDKADVMWRYTPTQSGRLRREGRLNKLDKKPEEDLEF